MRAGAAGARRGWDLSAGLPERVAPTCLFDSEAWLGRWATTPIETFDTVEYVVERAGGDAPRQALPLYTVKFSPFWQGYELQTEVAPLCPGPIVFAGSVYSMYTKRGHVPEALVAGAFQEGMERIARQEANLLVVPNLTEEGVADWVRTAGEPAGRVLLDLTYHCHLAGGFEEYLRRLDTDVRRDVGRRLRRAAERGLRVRLLPPDEAEPLLDRALQLTVGTSDHHSWPALYDLPTLRLLLSVPGSVTAVAEVDGEILGVFFGFRHGDDEIVFLTGGVEYGSLTTYSTYVALMYRCIEWAHENGIRRIEWGRDNYRFKERHGLTPVELWGLVYAPAGDAGTGRKVAHMHDVLSGYMESSR